MRSHNKKFLSKVSKVLADDNKGFNILKFLIYVLPEYVCWLLFIFIDREFHPKCLQ